MVESDKTNPGLKPGDPFFELEMVNLEGLDIEVELASFAGENNGWDASNILDNIGSPSSFNSSSHPDLRQPNTATEEHGHKEIDSSTLNTFPTNENVEPIAEQAAPLTSDPNLNGPIIATQNEVETTIEAAYNKENSSNCEIALVAATAFVEDPNTLPHHQSLPTYSAPLLNQTTLPTHSSPSPVGLISEIAGSSIQDKDMANMGCFCQFPHMQNENANIHGVLGMANQQSISNAVAMPNIIMGSNSFSGINQHQHSAPYPALCYIYPIEAGQSSGQFMTNQRPALPHIAQISGRLQNNQFPNPNLYGSHYSANHMQHESSTSYRPPNPFSPLLHQDGHAIGMQKIYDLQSQNYLQAATYPTYPKPEQQVHLHNSAASVQVPANNLSHNQHGYNGRPNAFVIVPPPNPHAIPSGRPLYSNYHPQSNPRPVTYNFFGTGSSMQPPTTYPVRYGNQNNNRYNPQGVGSLQLKVSQGVPIRRKNGYNRLLLNTPNYVQRQSHPLLHKPRAPLTGHSSVPRAVWSRNLLGQQAGPSRAPIPDEGSSSQGSNSSPLDDEYARLISLLRPEKDSGVQKGIVTPISTNNLVTNRRDKGKRKLPESSSTPRQPSEAIRRILDMNPRRTVTRNAKQDQNPQNNLSRGRMGGWIDDLKVQMGSSKGPIAAAALKITEGQGQDEKPRRGRPAKRRGPTELSSSSKLQIRKSGAPPEAADESPQNEVQSANPTGPPPSASSELSNGIYDRAYEKIGLPVDPFLRFQAFLGK